MDRGEHIIAHNTFGDQDRIFEVVAIPGHERAEHVLAQRKFAKIGGWTVSNNIPLLDQIADLYQRTLGDRRVLLERWNLRIL